MSAISREPANVFSSFFRNAQQSYNSASRIAVGASSVLGGAQPSQHVSPTSSLCTAASNDLTEVEGPPEGRHATRATCRSVLVPVELIPIVNDYVAAQKLLSDAEDAFAARTAKMVARLTQSSTNVSDDSVEIVSGRHSTAVGSGDEAGDDALVGVHLVEHDISICRHRVAALRAAAASKSDIEAQQYEASSLSDDAAALASDAMRTFAGAVAALQASVMAEQTRHEEVMRSAVEQWSLAQGTFATHQAAADEEMLQSARDALDKLDTMERRLTSICQQKTQEVEDVRGRLSTRDAYDPEVGILKKTTTQLTSQVDVVTNQLSRVQQLRVEIEQALGGADRAREQLGRDCALQSVSPLSSSLRQTPTSSLAPSVFPQPVASSAAASPVMHIPSGSVAVANVVVADDTRSAPLQQEKPQRVVQKRERDEVTAPSLPTLPVEVRPQVERRASTSVPVKLKVRSSANVAPHHRGPTAAVSGGASANEDCCETSAKSGGFFQFFKAIADRVVGDIIDDVVVETTFITSASPDSSPAKKARRTDTVEGDEYRAVGSTSLLHASSRMSPEFSSPMSQCSDTN